MLCNFMPGIPVPPSGPDLAGPLIHPSNGFLNLNRLLKDSVYLRMMRLPQSAEVTVCRQTPQYFPSSTLLFQSSVETVMEDTEKISVQALNLCTLSTGALKSFRHRLQHSLPDFRC